LKSSLRGFRIVLAAGILLLLASAGAAADFSPGDWRYIKDVVLPPGIQNEALVEIAPDIEVFSGASGGLADLRITGGDGREIPYKLEISRAESERTSFAVSILDKGSVPGSHTVFTADLGRAGILHNEIEFRTPAEEFRRQATVETSQDGAVWMLVAEQTVYAFTVKERGFTTRNTSIRYPESTARYLRVRIADEGEGPLEITGATVFYVKETPAREIVRQASILSIDRDDAAGTTNVVIDLGAPGIPSHRLAIDVSDVNFYREVTLQSSRDREQWDTLVRGAEIYAFDTPRFVGSSLALSYPEATSRYLRLVIQDEDNPLLDVRGVKVWGLYRRMVFYAEPGQSYRLYYGNPEAGKPSYDIERIFPYLITEGLPEAEIGSQYANPSFEEKKPPVSERFPWLFPVVIAVAAVIVAFLLVVVFRQVRKALPPPQE
jgi:hypothetical protein